MARDRSRPAATAGSWYGGWDYVPPEMLRGEKTGPPADIYCVGCLLYECLTGVVPFVRDSHVSLLFAHVNDEPPALTEVMPTLPASLDAVVRRAMGKDPNARYPSAGSLASAVLGALSR